MPKTMCFWRARAVGSASGTRDPATASATSFICKRFGKPGKSLLGADSHTPAAGGFGMLAIRAGGLEVGLAMGGDPFYTTNRKC
jgi:hypothetical protein